MEPVSSAGDDILDAVFGRDMVVILPICRERRADALQGATGVLSLVSRVR